MRPRDHWDDPTPDELETPEPILCERCHSQEPAYRLDLCADCDALVEAGEGLEETGLPEVQP